MTRQQQLHHRPHLRGGHLEGAPRRVPRRDRAGHPAHHRRDQGAHPRRAPRASTSPSSRSAARSATSSRCPFLEAIRQLQDRGRPAERAVSVHVTLVPYIADRRRAEDQADAALREGDARDRHPARHPALPHADRRSRSAHQGEDRALLERRRSRRVITAHRRRRASTRCRSRFHAEGLDELHRRAAQHLEPRSRTSTAWQRIVERFKNPTQRHVKIGIVGKYVHLKDVVQVAPRGARPRRHRQRLQGRPRVHRLRADRGEGRRGAARRPRRHPGARRLRRPRHRGEDRGDPLRARERSIPFFGICLGMQLAVVEFARNVAGLAGANSSEFDQRHAVPGHRPDARAARRHATRAAPCASARTRASLAPGTRRRARPTARPRSASATATATSSRTTTASSSQQAGLVLSGTSPDKQPGRDDRAARTHPYFVGCQFHPEFKSRPTAPHPLFARFVRAALDRQAIRSKGETRKTTESHPGVN